MSIGNENRTRAVALEDAPLILEIHTPTVKKNIPFALAALLIAVAPLCATTVQRLSLEDLAKRASRIVGGTVRDSKTFWSNNGKLILTNYVIDVDESIKGQYARTIEVTTVGGRIGGVELHVSGMPSFTKGETIVVFTESSGSYEVVLGLGQGKFKVENGEVSNQVTDLSFPDGRAGQQLILPIGTFKNRIRTILGR